MRFQVRNGISNPHFVTLIGVAAPDAWKEWSKESLPRGASIEEGSCSKADKEKVRDDIEPHLSEVQK